MSRIPFDAFISFAIATTLLQASCALSSSATEPSGNSASRCENDDDCFDIPNATACRSGYCVNANGERVAVDSSVPNAAGSGGAGNDDSKTDSDGNGFIAENDSGGHADPDAAQTDGDGGTGEIDITPVDICDGSNSIRLLSNMDGGFVDRFYYFLQPYGYQAFYVDGQCRYWVFQNGFAGILTGTLSDQEVENLIVDLRLGQFSEFEGYRDRVCPEGGGISLGDGTYSFGCTCGCFDAPKALQEAITNVATWYTNLLNQAEPLAGPIRLIVLSESSPAVGSPSPYEWPLDWDPEMVLTSSSDVEGSYPDWDTVGTIIDDPQEIQLLRDFATRVRNDKGEYPRYPIYVNYERENDHGTSYYTIIFRDETPPDLRAMIEAL